MGSTTDKRACVVVLGDWGRSPRMQYHALSLAKNGFLVDVVAFSGTAPHEAVQQNESIVQYSLRNVPRFENYLPRLIVYILKVLWQSLFLCILLFSLTTPNIMIIQNPPSIPVLPVCWFVCLLRRTKMVIDFHNYGFSILALTVGTESFLVKMCRWCEKIFGRKASHNLCVTRAMQEDLAKNWNISSTTFYDCPPEMFHPISIEEKHYFFLALSEQYSIFKSNYDHTDTDDEYTRFTIKKDNDVFMLHDRSPVIISSTSWTEDEDFSILLNALKEYEEVAASSSNLPKLLVIITGKGPLKEMYEKLIDEKNFSFVEIVTMWLPAKYYPTMLACADLGISLHCSSSGLDLPMKVVDMFGSGLPVCAYHYPCIEELVKETFNGLCFADSQQLSSQLQKLFRGFPQNSSELQKYRKNLIDNPLLRWDESWNEHVLPIVTNLVNEAC